jgi:hypothetical protein
MDLEDRVARVVLAREKRVLLESCKVRLDRSELLRDLALEVGLERVQLLGVLELELQALVALELPRDARVLSGDACRRGLVVAKAGCSHRLLEHRATGV